jgi:colanic acid biosynthesis glycosyl transferase WcaI
MRVLLLNQYFPPDPAPTGMLLGELAERLRADGHTVDFVDAGAPYRAGQKQQGRARRELTALARMLWRGLRGPRPDAVISATSPPLLLVIATLVALRHRARSIHWAMDL